MSSKTVLDWAFASVFKTTDGLGTDIRSMRLCLALSNSGNEAGGCGNWSTVSFNFWISRSLSCKIDPKNVNAGLLDRDLDGKINVTLHKTIRWKEVERIRFFKV